MMAEPPVLLAAGAVKSALELLLPSAPFADSSLPVLRFGTAGALRERLLAGEAADAVITSASEMAVLCEKGRVQPGSEVVLGSAATGLARHRDAAPHDISTPAALRDTLLAARAIGWPDPAAGATAGIHFGHVVERLGIADEVRAKARLFVNGVTAVAACGRGEVELAVSQVTEMRDNAGVVALGPFPKPHGLATTYVAAPLGDTLASRALMDWLGGTTMRDALARIGFVVAPETHAAERPA